MPTAPLLAILGGSQRLSLPGVVRDFDAGMVAGLSSGDPVVTWTDQSTAAASISQGTASKRPTWVTNVLGGNAVVRFDGTDDFLTGSPVSINGPFSIMVVCTPTGANSRFMIECGEAGTDNVNYYFYINGTAGPLENGFNDGTGGAGYKGFQGITPTLSAPMVCSVVYTGNLLRQWRNGVLSSTSLAVTATPTIAGTQVLNIGSNRAGTSPWSGDIARVILGSGAWTDSARARAERVLGKKYGFAVA